MKNFYTRVMYEGPEQLGKQLLQFPSDNMVIVADTLVGFGSRYTDVTASTAQMPGQVLVAQKIEPMELEMTILLTADHELKFMAAYQKLVRAFHPALPGVLSVNVPNIGWRYIDVRLAEPIDPPEVDIALAHGQEITVKLISDQGVWYGLEKFTGASGDRVRVYNRGDIPSYPLLHLLRGANVTTPAGFVFGGLSNGRIAVDTRPQFVNSPQIVGSSTRSLTEQEKRTFTARSLLVAEPIPAHSSAVYHVAGGELEIYARHYFLNPWV